MSDDYPAWICANCGRAYGHKPIPGIATWHYGECGICKANAPVTEPRDFGHLKPSWKKWRKE